MTKNEKLFLEQINQIYDSLMNEWNDLVNEFGENQLTTDFLEALYEYEFRDND